jgi:hypothetical protein
MGFELPPFWDVVVDGIQIVLCLLILLFLFRIRKKKQQSVPARNRLESEQSFNEQVFIQALKQRVDQALASIAEKIAVEQRNLDEWLSTINYRNLPMGLLHNQSGLQRSVDDRISPIAGTASSIDQVHEQIQNLAGKGMTAQQISEKLKTPLGEVELVLSLGSSVGKR